MCQFWIDSLAVLWQVNSGQLLYPVELLAHFFVIQVKYRFFFKHVKYIVLSLVMNFSNIVTNITELIQSI